MNRFLITAICALLAMPAMAQEDALKDLPGYVVFGDMKSFYGEPKVNISIGSALLGFVGAMAKNDNPEAAGIFNRLKGVRVSVYSTKGNSGPALDQVSKVKRTLIASKWEPIVQVNDEDEQVQIFIKMAANKIDGLTLMAVDEEEAVFINVIGQLDPQELAGVMDNFDIDIEDALDID